MRKHIAFASIIGVCASIFAAGMLAFGSSIAAAQDAVSSPAPDIAVVTTTTAGDDTTVINTPVGQPTTIEQGDTTVVVPVGTWVDQTLAAIQSSVGLLIAALIAWAFRALPKSVVDILKMLQAEQLLKRAADYGINATRGAVAGKELALDVGNEAVAKAVQYAVDNGPAWLIEWLGGERAIIDKIVARIPLAGDVGREDIVR
jgi:hypothetical protein